MLVEPNIRDGPGKLIIKAKKNIRRTNLEGGGDSCASPEVERICNRLLLRIDFDFF